MPTLIAVNDEMVVTMARVVAAKKMAFARNPKEVAKVARVLRPSAAVIDVRLGGNGFRAVELVPLILKASPGAAVVMITDHIHPQEVEEAKLWGAYEVIERSQLAMLRVILSVGRAVSSHQAEVEWAFSTRAIQ